MKAIYKSPLALLLPLVVIEVFVLSAGVSWGEEGVEDKERQGVMPQEDVRVKDIKIGERVTCITRREDVVVEDPQEYGPPIKWERIAGGIVTDIQDGEISIKIEGIADYWYIKKDSSWIADTSIRKPPPYSVGYIYKCNPSEIKEHKRGLVTYKYGTSINRLLKNSQNSASST